MAASIPFYVFEVFFNFSINIHYWPLQEMDSAEWTVDLTQNDRCFLKAYELADLEAFLYYIFMYNKEVLRNS